MISTGHSDSQPHYHALNKASFTYRTAQSTARHLLPYIQPHHRILDTGCGPGSITADLAELVPGGEVVGIDINADFVEAGKALAKERGMKNLSFQVGDITTDLANIEPSTFDIVHAHQLLLHLPDPLSVMQQMRRIPKPGGCISTVDSAIKLIISSNPGILASEAAYENLSKGNPTFGQTSHITAHPVGFAWDDIETSSWTMPEMGVEGRERIRASASATAEGFVEGGAITEEEAEGQVRGWVEWAGLREGRWFEVARGVVCWKR